MTRKSPPDGRSEFQRILVICTRQIGDVLLTTPLIHAAKRRWPGAAIDVLGFAGTLGMLKGNPDVHQLVEVPPGSGWLQSIETAHAVVAAGAGVRDADLRLRHLADAV